MAFSLQISYIRVLFLAFLTTSFPRSNSQTFEILAQNSIDACVKDADGLPSFVHSLANKVNDQGVKSRLSGCEVNAENALGRLKDAKQQVMKKFYGAARENAHLAKDTLSICEHSFQTPPAVEPVELKQAFDRLEGLVSNFINIIVANHMA